jgi:hypothetical protein
MQVNWRCPITGTVYAARDRRLAGRGNPPSVPLEAGQGTCVMQPTFDAVSTTAEDRFDGSYTDRAHARSQPITPQ